MSRRLPPNATLAKWAITLAPAAAKLAQGLYETGRFRQLAIMHARTLRHGTFGDAFVAGERVWVVWSGTTPVASYPEVDPDELTAAAGRTRTERRQDPDDLPAQRLRDRARSAGARARGTLRRGSDDDASSSPEPGTDADATTTTPHDRS